MSNEKLGNLPGVDNKENISHPEKITLESLLTDTYNLRVKVGQIRRRIYLEALGKEQDPGRKERLQALLKKMEAIESLLFAAEKETEDSGAWISHLAENDKNF